MSQSNKFKMNLCHKLGFSEASFLSRPSVDNRVAINHLLVATLQWGHPCAETDSRSPAQIYV